MVGAARAEDIFVDAYMSIADNLAQFRGTSQFSTWVYTACRNFCADYMRRSQREDGRTGDLELHSAISPISRAEMEISLEKVTSTLSVDERDLLTSMRDDYGTHTPHSRQESQRRWRLLEKLRQAIRAR
jgi:RNA polymerase sigma factor (sigma-70 family)